ncbi:MAG: methyltransferase domain-containing protein [Chloroflexi bacterium]|nr:methyltransferase domain-containing protein [Chloroflexota bacterium]
MAALFGDAAEVPDWRTGPRVQVVQTDGQQALVVEGVVQSVAVDGPDIGRGYWPALLPDAKPRSALILGLAGGTIVHLLRRRFGPLPITGVDDDVEVLAVARQRFSLGQEPELRVVVDDAFDYVANCQVRFDYICVDLFRAGQVPRQVTATPFLRQARRLLEPGGAAIFDLARDRRAQERIHRLGRIFLVERQVLVGLNVVVHCRPPVRPVRGEA